ncbi:hypothetical protein AB0J43_57020 [Nonomuraea fuscirosea]
MAAAFEAQRARQAQQAEQRAAGGTQTSPARPAAGTGGALVAGLLALAEQSARLVKRFPGLVRLDVAQQADAAVALDDPGRLHDLGAPGHLDPPGRRPGAAPRPAQDRDHVTGEPADGMPGDEAPQHASGNARDDGEDALHADIAQFTAMERNGPWLMAYLVARRVAPGAGDGVGLEQKSTKCFDRNTFRRVSAREFARRAGTSAKRVLALWQAWNRLADEGVVDHAMDLQPDTDVELPDVKQYPFNGEKGYYRSLDARPVSPERREAIEREAATSGTRPSAITYVIGHPTAVKTVLLADESTRQQRGRP